MKLKVFSREVSTKGTTKAIRRAGDLPANLYAKGKENKALGVSGEDFGAAMRGLKPGHLPTTIFLLNDGKKEVKAIVKEIQYHPTTYSVMHIDFLELSDQQPVDVKVPIQCVGIADCVGIKQGGFLKQVKRCVEIQCLPKDIPAEFVVDIKNLGLFQSKKLSDLAMPKGIKLLAEETEIVVSIGKR